MLIVHHLGVSQSDRIVWLCEELELPYKLVLYKRDPKNGGGPAEYKALHPYGTAPVIQDGDVTLAESSAILEYLITKYSDGRLAVGPDKPNYPDYLFWLHFANGSFMPGGLLALPLLLSGIEPTELMRRFMSRYDRGFEIIERRLGKSAYLAGPEFTAADIMTLFPLTTMRLFVPHDISGYPNLLDYLQRIAARPALQRARQKADPDLPPNIT